VEREGTEEREEGSSKKKGKKREDDGDSKKKGKKREDVGDDDPPEEKKKEGEGSKGEARQGKMRAFDDSE